MNANRLNELCELNDRVQSLERALSNMKHYVPFTGAGRCGARPSQAAMDAATKLLEQDMEEQLALAKRNFEEAQ